MSDEEKQSVKDYVEASKQKDLISQLLKQSAISIPEEYHEEITEKVLEKLKLTNSLRLFIKLNNSKIIKETAEANGVNEAAVIDAFVYFFLIVENVILSKYLEDMQNK